MEEYFVDDLIVDGDYITISVAIANHLGGQRYIDLGYDSVTFRDPGFLHKLKKVKDRDKYLLEKYHALKQT